MIQSCRKMMHNLSETRLPAGPHDFIIADSCRLRSGGQQVLAQSPIGVFSHADTVGIHSPDDPEEAVHALFHATKAQPNIRRGCIRFIFRQILAR